MQLLLKRMPGWRCRAILFRPLATVAPGIEAALRRHGMTTVEVDGDAGLDDRLPADAKILMLGAVFEQFALDLFAWAKTRSLAVIAIQEVAQLALNQLDISNYDAPFDRLFLASPEERRLCLKLGYPGAMLRVSGLLAHDRFGASDSRHNEEVLRELGIADREKPVVYTTSPVRSRLALHNKDDRYFRGAVLEQLAVASRRTGRMILVKLHPNENLETEREKIRKIVPNALVIGRELSMEELFPAASVLVNRGNSQTCLDGVFRGIPTVVVACGLKTLFHDDGGVYLVETIDKLADAIDAALATGAPDSSTVRAKHLYQPPVGAANVVAAEIEAVAEKAWPVAETCWNWLIKSMLFMGRHDRALLLCDQLNVSSPWREAVRTALKAHLEGRLQDAITAWLECAAHDREWFFPHYELAHGYLANGQYLKAIEHAREAIALHPPFHSLWHELPMRVVIMTSLRKTGDVNAAGAELKSLENRGLVDIVPELLIEAAAQHGHYAVRLRDAEQCLAHAAEQLKRYPVHPSADSHIFERLAWQYLEVAKRYAEIENPSRSFACAERVVRLAGANEAQLDQAVFHFGELGEDFEKGGDLSCAEKCYSLGLEVKPSEHWLRYKLGRLALKRGKLRDAVRILQTIARIPGAAKFIIDTALTPVGSSRLLRHWPGSPKSLIKPLWLSLCTARWFVPKLARGWFKNPQDIYSCTLLVWIFVGEHFFARLRSEYLKLRKFYYRFKSASRTLVIQRRLRVTSCPICHARDGKFEYQNKQTPLFRCLVCDHVYARDLPDDAALNALYDDFSYWEKDRGHQGISAIHESKEWDVYLRARMGILERLRLLNGPGSSPKSVFEIGCSEGMLLNELRKRGMIVKGCEMNRPVAEQGIKRLGVEILTAPFETLNIEKKNYDLVMSFHTLEHMKFPAQVLAKVADSLRPDGALLLEVPCGEEEYENTDHLHFFSEASLKLLLNRFFVDTEIVMNSYTNSAGVPIGSIYGVGRRVRIHRDQ